MLVIGFGNTVGEWKKWKKDLVLFLFLFPTFTMYVHDLSKSQHDASVALYPVSCSRSWSPWIRVFRHFDDTTHVGEITANKPRFQSLQKKKWRRILIKKILSIHFLLFFKLNSPHKILLIVYWHQPANELLLASCTTQKNHVKTILLVKDLRDSRLHQGLVGPDGGEQSGLSDGSQVSLLNEKIRVEHVVSRVFPQS